MNTAIRRHITARKLIEFEANSKFKSNGDFTAQQEFVMRSCASEMAVKQTQICLSKVNPEND